MESISSAFLYAFLGGMILNLMPCVLPVLSIKVFSLLKKEGQVSKLATSLAYTSGILVSFLTFAAVIVLLKSSGRVVGWGFQLQNPGFVLTLSLLFFILALNMYGFFDFTIPSFMIPQNSIMMKGLAGEFFNGVLIALVASPCTAPFMGAALGFAFTQPIIIIFGIFSALALGLAIPFLLIALIPAFSKLLPKPGTWMIELKQFFSFPLFATAIWLLWIYQKQTSIDHGFYALNAILAITLCIWSVLKTKHLIRIVTLCIGIFTVSYTIHLTQKPVSRTTESGELFKHGRHWLTFKPGLAESLSAQGKTVFIDFTAAWCITCQSNAKIIFSSNRVHKFLDKNENINLIYADWTNENDDITTELTKYGRSGVPMYLVYKDGREPFLMPQILTPQIFIDALSPN